MTDIVLESEAKTVQENAAKFATKPSWLAKGRSVQNLNKFIKGATEVRAARRRREARNGTPRPPPLPRPRATPA